VPLFQSLSAVLAGVIPDRIFYGVALAWHQKLSIPFLYLRVQDNRNRKTENGGSGGHRPHQRLKVA
jgi:hypothetical protein